MLFLVSDVVVEAVMNAHFVTSVGFLYGEA